MVSGRWKMGGIFNLEIDAMQDQMFDPSDKPGILFGLHSPFEPFNAYVRGHFLKPGKSYQVILRVEEHRLLKHPYKTDCTNYTEIWLANNRTGPRSKIMCMELCQAEWSMYSRECEWGLTMYKGINPMCTTGNSLGTFNKKKYFEKYYKAREKCLQKCKKECVKQLYWYTIDKRTIPWEVERKDKRNSSDFIYIHVYLDEPEVLVQSHNPKYLDVEAFSYIGGFMGCWLGVSIWALAHNVGSTMNLAVARIKNCFKRKNKKSSTQSLST
ncbi:hypothetical protein JTE90_022066 [Oedothorax gibbosus]|uniref:Uncharacterized protein n=1 Tax=Oedothorax gibbosus TaxID=931172 RepID=A0AAV6TY42_9ARAC|nr:hypothetical protein JTE90_022066 [Oedothorax gibbosus]